MRFYEPCGKHDFQTATRVIRPSRRPHHFWKEKKKKRKKKENKILLHFPTQWRAKTSEPKVTNQWKPTEETQQQQQQQQQWNQKQTTFPLFRARVRCVLISNSHSISFVSFASKNKKPSHASQYLPLAPPKKRKKRKRKRTSGFDLSYVFFVSFRESLGKMFQR